MMKLNLLALFLTAVRCFVIDTSSTRNAAVQYHNNNNNYYYYDYYWFPLRSSLERGENPCWQDFYDDDCSMDHVYQASFVAGEWLKRMPCAEGLEDCDMPEDFKVPANRPESVLVDAIDVASFLNLKRAKPLVVSKGNNDLSP